MHACMASSSGHRARGMPKPLHHLLFYAAPALLISLLALVFFTVVGFPARNFLTGAAVVLEYRMFALVGDDAATSLVTANVTSPTPSDDDGSVLVGQTVGPRPRRSDKSGRSPLTEESCDIFDGMWVLESGPRYPPGSCPFVDVAYDCIKNGRPDTNYTKLTWQPRGCSMPRWNGSALLEFLRGKRLAFVGDSLNRNMWESMACMLRQSLQDKRRVSEISGRKEFRTENSYAFRFQDYNCTVEFYWSPFLVQEWSTLDSDGSKRETLRLDVIEGSSDRYRDADVIVFNSGHWWTHEKTSKGQDYYQEGDHVHPRMSVRGAYSKAMKTWARWVDANINSNRTRVFFRGYSWSHFSGGQWNSGGNCDGETEPITDDKHLGKYLMFGDIVGSAINEMKTTVHFLNITRMTDYRKDGHPSVYRTPAEKRRQGEFQDCSHWCLPGVPDAWNELLYAVLSNEFMSSK